MTPPSPIKYVDLPDCWQPISTPPDDDDDGRWSCRKCQVQRDPARATALGWYYQEAGRDDPDDPEKLREAALWVELGRGWPRRYWFLCQRCHGDRNRLLSPTEADAERRRRHADAQLTQYMLRWRMPASYRPAPDPRP